MKTLALTLAAAATGIVGLATPAFANPMTVKTEHVRYGDLDLSASEGQKTLESRVDAAVKRVCGIAPLNPADLARLADARSCVAKARASARQQMALATDSAARGG